MAALRSKSHILAESFILPTLKEMGNAILECEAEREIRKVPLSNNTIQKRTVNLSDSIKKNIQENVQNSEFALEVGEFTDISNKKNLLAFIHFFYSNQIINQILCCKEQYMYILL